MIAAVMRLTSLDHLSDAALRREVGRLAGTEREATVAFIVYLAEFEARRLYAEPGFSSAFAYGVEVLHLSEDAAYNRIEAARAVRDHPAMVEMLARGALSPTTARMLRRRLTAHNHEEVLAAAAFKSKHQVEELLAARFPRPDVRTSIRRVPPPDATTARALAAVHAEVRTGPEASAALSADWRTGAAAFPPVPATPRVVTAVPDMVTTALSLAPVLTSADHRPSRPAVVRPLSAERYEVRFTASADTRELLREAQDLLARSIPAGDLDQILNRALRLLVRDLYRRKAATVQRATGDTTVAARLSR
jgi:hypothetical protein